MKRSIVLLGLAAVAVSGCAMTGFKNRSDLGAEPSA